MRTENGKIQGVTTLREDLDLSGMWSGDCTVAGGATFYLRGTVTGNLTVDADCEATVDGTVSGDHRAHGPVVVRGVVRGHASGNGLDLRAGARISGRTV